MSAPNTLSQARPSSVDVVVIGAGLAGSALTVLLAEAGVNVIMIDETTRPHREYGECLPAAAKPMLTTLGLWGRFVKDAHLPAFGSRAFWGSEEPTEHDYRDEGLGCAWHLDRYLFEHRLIQRVGDVGARVCAPVRITAVDKTGGGSWRLSLASPMDQWVVAAKFVVDATGVASRFAERLGVSRIVKDKLTVLSCLLDGDPRYKDKDSFTNVEAIENGWWYSALAPEGRRIASFVTDGDLLSKKETATHHWSAMMKRSSWTRNHLSTHGYRMGDAPRLKHSGTTRLERFSGKGWLAVGDAAFSCDPLCSQGITAPLLSAFHAKDTIVTLFRGNREASAAYADLMDLAFNDYLSFRLNLYNRETRWPEAVFWRRRRRKEKIRTGESGIPLLNPFSMG